MTNIIRIGVVQLSATALLAKGQHILASLTNNPAFPDPEPSLQVFSEQLEALEKSITAASDGGRTQIILMHEQRKRVVAMVRHLANYVDRTAEGNVEKIATSGYELRKRAAAREVNSAPDGLYYLSTEEKRTIPLRWKPVTGTRLYEIQISEADAPTEETWKLVSTSPASRFIAKVTQSAKYYWFRVRALGRTGAGPWSDPIAALSQ